MTGSDDEVKVGTGKSPNGAAVSYYEIDRPATIGAKGSQGFLVEARDAKGVRMTHSDSLKGLLGAGFTLDVLPPSLPPAPEKTIEEELGA